MTDEARRARNAAMLAECYPTFRARLERVLAAMEAAGYRPRIQQAWRSPEQQLEAFRTGRSKLRWGFHNATGPQGQKEALACDVLDDDSPLASRRPYLLQLAACARAEGLQTGVLWGLPPRQREAVIAAIASGDFEADVKIGWDAAHTEPADITSVQARKGARPL